MLLVIAFAFMATAAATVYPAAGATTGALRMPVLMLWAEWSGQGLQPTVIAKYEDGTEENLQPRLGQSWRPNRPIEYVTVQGADVGCEIWVNGALFVQDRARDGRHAGCTLANPGALSD